MTRTALRLCILMIFVLPVVSFGQAAEQLHPPSWFWGCWVVSRPLPTPGVSGLSPEQVHAILGTRIVYKSTHARSGRTIVSDPEYSTSKITNQDFLLLGHVRFKQIGIDADKAIRVQLLNSEFSDLDFPGTDVFLRKTDLVIEVENEYFVAERAKAQDHACEVPKSQNK